MAADVNTPGAPGEQIDYDKYDPADLNRDGTINENEKDYLDRMTKDNATPPKEAGPGPDIVKT